MHVRLCVLPGGGDPHLEAVSLCTAIQPAGVVSARVGLLISAPAGARKRLVLVGGGRSGGRALVGRAVPVGAGASRFGAAGAAPAARGGRPTLLDENRLARQDRTAGRECVAALFHAGERGVSDPLLPAVMENAEGRRLHLLRFRTGPGKTGARDRYGHALTGTEAGSRRYVATAGSTWRRRRPKPVWASRRPATPAGPDRCRRAGFSRAWSPQSARGEAWWLTTVSVVSAGGLHGMRLERPRSESASWLSSPTGQAILLSRSAVVRPATRWPAARRRASVRTASHGHGR